MNRLIKIIGVTTLTISLRGGNQALADEVIDITPTTIAGWAMEASSWAKQIESMQQQFEKLQQTYQQVQSTYTSMTGNRGIGNVLSLTNSMRNYLPQGASDMVGVLNNANNTYSGMSNQIQALANSNSILSNASLANMNMLPAQLKLLTDQRTNTAAIQSIAAQGMANASQRFSYLQTLMSQINGTTDPKAIAELNARIASEQTMMTNEQTKLQQINSFMQNQNAVTAQQRREMAIQQIGDVSTLKQPNLANINFNN